MNSAKASWPISRIPKRFFVRPILPLLPNGKIDKVALKAEVQGIVAQEQSGG